MEQQEDPEARIRELERSLTDQARASEVAAQPYTAPYSTPFPMTTGTTSTGFGKAWLVLGMFAVGMLILAGGIAFFALQHFSSGGPIPSSPSFRPGTPAGGSFTDRPSGGPSASDSESPTSETEAVPPGGELTISGVFTKRTIACNDSTITVMGSSNTVVITGHCGSLSVLGSKNVVTVDSADTINASGTDNQVTYHSGTPEIDKFGSNNIVEQG